MPESRILGDRYQLTDVLGVGGMSLVYRARDRATGTDVALKVLASNLVHDPVIGDRFTAEAEHLGAVSHPNLVRILDVGSDGDDRYLAMELITGETLEQRLRRERALPLAEVAATVTDVASGLAALHQRGFVHRDVKPANILLGDDGVARLGDFGLVRGVPMGLTLPGTAVGTLSYLAPELLRGEGASPASDAWALGAVAYRAVTGVLPYPSGTVTELVMEHAHPPDPPSLIEPTLPASVDGPLMAILGPADARPQVLTFAALLSAIAAGATVPGAARDWADASTAVAGFATPTRTAVGIATVTAASRQPRGNGRSTHRRRVVARAAIAAAACLVVAAIALAAGFPRTSTRTLSGSIDSLSRALESAPSGAPPTQPAAAPTDQPVTEAAQHAPKPEPPHGDNGHGPGPKPGHGPGEDHGNGHGNGHGEGGNGD